MAGPLSVSAPSFAGEEEGTGHLVEELESSLLAFFVHAGGTVELSGVVGQALPSEIGPLNHQVYPGLGCWALAWQVFWGPLMRMSEPSWADMVARITYAFCFSFSMSGAPMFTYIKLLWLRLTFLI